MTFFRQCEPNTRLTANNTAIIKVALFLLRVFDFDSILYLEPDFYKSYLIKEMSLEVVIACSTLYLIEVFGSTGILLLRAGSGFQ